MVLVVAHSQDNFFANEAFDRIYDDRDTDAEEGSKPSALGPRPGAMRIVGIATPDGRVEGLVDDEVRDDFHIKNSIDFIGWVPESLPTNTGVSRLAPPSGPGDAAAWSVDELARESLPLGLLSFRECAERAGEHARHDRRRNGVAAVAIVRRKLVRSLFGGLNCWYVSTVRRRRTAALTPTT